MENDRLDLDPASLIPVAGKLLRTPDGRQLAGHASSGEGRLCAAPDRLGKRDGDQRQGAGPADDLHLYR